MGGSTRGLPRVGVAKQHKVTNSHKPQSLTSQHFNATHGPSFVLYHYAWWVITTPGVICCGERNNTVLHKMHNRQHTPPQLFILTTPLVTTTPNATHIMPHHNHIVFLVLRLWVYFLWWCAQKCDFLKTQLFAPLCIKMIWVAQFPPCAYGGTNISCYVGVA